MEQNLALLKWNINRDISPGRDSSFSPSAATNQQNSVRDVVQLSQIQTIAISEAINQVHKKTWEEFYGTILSKKVVEYIPLFLCH